MTFCSKTERTTPPRRGAALFCCLLLALPCAAHARGYSIESMRKSLVQIYVTIQPADYIMPWQGANFGSATGTGFIIDKRRILTNAHIVSNARRLEVQKDGQAARFPAEVSFIAHDCDLAELTVEDPSFFDNTSVLELAADIPNLNDEVTVMGYPLGGTRVSLTRGVVSRIDYSVYSHSGVDEHLVLQVDAAINPGNSGGPIIFNNKVVGLAFQGIAWAENIGYGIPSPVVRRFLEDIKDGVYDGYPELGIGFMETRNPALRRSLGLPDSKTGILIHYVDPFGAAKGHLRPGDVLLAIDGHAIGNDGTTRLKGNPVVYAELIERKQRGQAINVSVWRNAKEVELNIPLTNPDDPFTYRNTYDTIPEYFIVGGLVFSPLSRGYLNAAAQKRLGRSIQQLLYYSQYAKIDNLYAGKTQFVVLTHRMPHPVNTYADKFLDGIVSRVNGVPITCLADVKRAVERPQDGFHVIEFEDDDDKLVLDADAASNADGAIKNLYGIGSLSHIEED